MILSRPQKVDGAPAVASRWLQRLEQLTKGLELNARLKDMAGYPALAHLLSEPDGQPSRMKRPAPTPPAEARPKRLSVTEIETWLRDPYAIYAKHVLRLRRWRITTRRSARWSGGTAVHAVLEVLSAPNARRDGPWMPSTASSRWPNGFSPKPESRKATLALWQPRFARGRALVRASGAVAAWRDRPLLRGAPRRARVRRRFTLRCQADRIDILRDGSAAIIDYKTATHPATSSEDAARAQLPLEGAILKEGGFPGVGAAAAGRTRLYPLQRRRGCGDFREVDGDIAALIAEAEAKLIGRIALFADPATPYTPRVMPFRADGVGDYDHLARRAGMVAVGMEAEE